MSNIQKNLKISNKLHDYGILDLLCPSCHIVLEKGCVHKPTCTGNIEQKN